MKTTDSTTVLAVIAGLGFALLASAKEPVPEGLISSDWAGIRGAHEAWQHRFTKSDDGTWSATNPGQNLRTIFDGRGFLAEPAGQPWRWGLELRSYGVGDARKTLTGEAIVSGSEQRLSYQWDETIEEWFLNDGRGLEQGWTLSDRPAGTDDEMLRLDLVVRGALRPVVDAGGQSVNFVTEDGAAVLTYGGLKAWDDTGRPLPTRFSSHANGIVVEVDERGATYPVTIDPIVQQAYLKASNTGAGDWFGLAVAVSGDTVVVGAGREDSSTTGVNSSPNNSASDAGAAYVFIRSGGVWSQQAYLKASNTGAGDAFGRSVGVSGDTVVVGAAGESSGTTGVNSTPDELAEFSGAVYVFTRSGVTWSQQAYLKASNTGVDDFFGNSVGVSGDTVVVGAVGEDSSAVGVNSAPNDLALNSGAAYVFSRSGVTWSQQAYLKAFNTGANDRFGESVAVSGDTVVVGATLEESSSTGVNSAPDDSAPSAGAAYVFTRDGVTWSQQAYLKSSNTGIGDMFGRSVAISGDTLVVGAHVEDSGSTGVNSAPNELAPQSGAAYVFIRGGPTWGQQAYLKPFNTGEDDHFGESVAISGDTIVVGADGEDSNSTGVNSAPNDLLWGTGAAYVFTRGATAWSQLAYLKPSYTGDDGSSFGAAVAVSGDTAVVGAYNDDSGTTGVNSVPDELANSSGAAFVFEIPPNLPNQVTTVPDLTSASDTGVSQFDNLTRQTLPTFTGTAVAGAAIEVSSDISGGMIGSDVADASGDWSVTPALALADGVHQIRASANGGCESPAKAVTIDTMGPAVTIEQAIGQADPAAGAPVNFDAVFSEDVNGFESGDVSLGGGAGPSNPDVSGGPASYTVKAGAVSGEGTVTASIGAGAATDRAGNASLASTSTDNSVVIDLHGGTAGTATAVDVSGGIGSGPGWLEPGDVDVFTFILTEAKHFQIRTTGSTNTVGSFRNAAGELLNDPNADDDRGAESNFQIDQVLLPGTFTVEVGGHLDNETGAYQLEIELGAAASLQPDNKVGQSVGATVGDGIYGTAAGQTLHLISEKARTVQGFSTIENDGELPSDFTVRGTRGNRLFRVSYASRPGNVTAQVVSGAYETGVMAPGDLAHVVSVTIKPIKKKILKRVNRRGRRRLIVKKKRITLALKSVSKTDGVSTDTGFIKVRTK